MLQFGPAQTFEYEAACRLLAGPARSAARYLELIGAGELDPAGLFVARDGGVRGAMLVQVMPGALGLAMMPVVERGIAADGLVATACDWLTSRGVKVCQAFPSEDDDSGPLERSGFRRVTELLDLEREPSACSLHLQYEPLATANRPAFARLLLETFHGSLDCPEVVGSRTEAELLAGCADMPLAWIARQENEPVGVVIIDEVTGSSRCELTYIGVHPDRRGRGHGADLVRFALQFASERKAQSVVLSVDARNAPARKLYETLGFKASGARSVFLKHHRPVS
jgi:ribosomal protein S18 acetylase RimI-like enzyme